MNPTTAQLAAMLMTPQAKPQFTAWLRTQLRNPNADGSQLSALAQYVTQHPNQKMSDNFHHYFSRASMAAGIAQPRQSTHLFALNVLTKHPLDSRLGTLTSTANLQQFLATTLHSVIKDTAAPFQAAQFSVFPAPIPTEYLAAQPVHQFMDFLHSVMLWAQNKPLIETLHALADITTHMAEGPDQLHDYTILFAFHGPASQAKALAELLPYLNSTSTGVQLFCTQNTGRKLAHPAMVLDIGTPWLIAQTGVYSSILYTLMQNAPTSSKDIQISCAFHQADPSSPIKANIALLQNHQPLCSMHLPSVMRPDLLAMKIWITSQAGSMAPPLLHSAIIPQALPKTLSYTPKGWHSRAST